MIAGHGEADVQSTRNHRSHWQLWKPRFARDAAHMRVAEAFLIIGAARVFNLVTRKLLTLT